MSECPFKVGDKIRVKDQYRPVVEFVRTYTNAEVLTISHVLTDGLGYPGIQFAEAGALLVWPVLFEYFELVTPTKRTSFPNRRRA